MQLRTHTYKRCVLTAHSESKDPPDIGAEALIVPVHVASAEVHAPSVAAALDPAL